MVSLPQVRLASPIILVLLAVTVVLGSALQFSSSRAMVYPQPNQLSEKHTPSIDEFASVNKTLFFHDDGNVTTLDAIDPMNTSIPQNTGVVDYEGDGNPGLTIDRGYDPSAPQTGQSTKYHFWVTNPPLAGNLSIVESLTVYLFVDNDGKSGNPESIDLELFSENPTGGRNAIATASTSLTLDGLSSKSDLTNGFEEVCITFIGLNSTLPRGYTLAINVTSSESGSNDLWFAYNNTNHNARILFSATTYVNVENIAIFDALGVERYAFYAGERMSIQTVVGDPLGAYDIKEAMLSVQDPDLQFLLENVSMDFESMDSQNPPFWKRYNHSLVLSNESSVGLHSVTVVGVESNDVLDIQSSSFFIVQPNITLELAVNKSVAQAGDSLIYTAFLNNSGGGTASKVWVNDTFPEGLTYNSDNASEVGGNRISDYSWFFANVSNGILSFRIVAHVNAGLADGSVLTNNVTLAYTDPVDRTYEASKAEATTIVASPFLRLDVMVEKNELGFGEVANMTVCFNNTGYGTARFVWINYSLAPELIFMDSTAGGYMTSPGHWEFTDVQRGNHSFITRAIVNESSPGFTINNLFDLLYVDGGGFPWVAPQVDVPLTVMASLVSLNVTTESSQVDALVPFNLLIYLNNSGNDVASLLLLNVTVPESVAFDSDNSIDLSHFSGRWIEGRLIQYRFTSVGPGTELLTLSLRAGAYVADQSLFMLNATLFTVDGRSGVTSILEDGVSLILAKAVLGIDIVGNGPTGTASGTIQYNVYFNNSGHGVSHQVWVACTLPVESEYLYHSAASSPHYDSSYLDGQTLHLNFTDVHPGTYNFTVVTRFEVVPRESNLVASVLLTYTNSAGSYLGQMYNEVTVHNPGSVLSEDLGVPLWLISILIIIFSCLLLVLLLVFKRLKPESVVDDLFVMHPSGTLIKHYSRRLKPYVDEDILTGMMTAVQEFTKDAMRGETGWLDELSFGEHKILLVKGKYAALAAFVSGSKKESMSNQMKVALSEVERKHGHVLEDWDGTVERLSGMNTVMEKLINGKLRWKKPSEEPIED